MKERAQKTPPNQISPVILALGDLCSAMYNCHFSLQETDIFLHHGVSIGTLDTA